MILQPAQRAGYPLPPWQQPQQQPLGCPQLAQQQPLFPAGAAVPPPIRRGERLAQPKQLASSSRGVPYKENDFVEVWSDSNKGWFDGIVLRCREDGAIRVRFEGLPDPPSTREKWIQSGDLKRLLKPRRNAADALNGNTQKRALKTDYKEGDEIEIWSDGAKDWFPGILLSIDEDGNVHVRYSGLPEPPRTREKIIERTKMAAVMRPRSKKIDTAGAREQAARANVATSYQDGDAVEVWSAGCQAWFRGVVLDVGADASVKVRYSGLPEPPTTREKRIRAIDFASALRPFIDSAAAREVGYNPGDAVDVWSASAADWIPGYVAEINSDGDVRVTCDLHEIWVPARKVNKQLRVHVVLNSEINEATVLAPLLKTFKVIDTDASGAINAKELARNWCAAAEKKAGKALTKEERELIAAGVQRRFEQVDMDGDGTITVEEWLHHVLLDKHPPGSACIDAINAKLRARGVGELSRIVSKWRQLDTDGSGALSHSELLAAASDDPDAQKLDQMYSNIDGEVSYAQYCACKLGLSFSPVELSFYDLSDGLAKYLAPVLLWRRFKGIWHTGTIVFGSEYYYGGGVWEDPPGDTPFGAPTKKKLLGLTLRTKQELDDLCREHLEWQYTEDNYDVLNHNCNHFSEEVVQFLLGKHIPDSVRKQPLQVTSSPIVKLLRPLLNRWLGKIEGGNRAGGSSKPSKSATRRTLEDAAREGNGELVLYDVATEEYGTVVARVTKIHHDGTLDLCWFKRAGVRQKATRIPRLDVRAFSPPKTSGGGGSRAEIFFAALQALDDAEEVGTTTYGASKVVRRQMGAVISEETRNLRGGHCSCFGGGRAQSDGGRVTRGISGPSDDPEFLVHSGRELLAAALAEEAMAAASAEDSGA